MRHSRKPDSAATVIRRSTESLLEGCARQLPAELGTDQQFRHLHPDPANPEFAAGWHWHLDRLHQLLEGAEPADVDEDRHFQDLTEQYRR